MAANPAAQSPPSKWVRRYRANTTISPSAYTGDRETPARIARTRKNTSTARFRNTPSARSPGVARRSAGTLHMTCPHSSVGATARLPLRPSVRADQEHARKGAVTPWETPGSLAQRSARQLWRTPILCDPGAARYPAGRAAVLPNESRLPSANTGPCTYPGHQLGYAPLSAAGIRASMGSSPTSGGRSRKPVSRIQLSTASSISARAFCSLRTGFFVQYRSATGATKLKRTFIPCPEAPKHHERGPKQHTREHAPKAVETSETDGLHTHCLDHACRSQKHLVPGPVEEWRARGPRPSQAGSSSGSPGAICDEAAG